MSQYITLHGTKPNDLVLKRIRELFGLSAQIKNGNLTFDRNSPELDSVGKAIEIKKRLPIACREDRRSTAKKLYKDFMSSWLEFGDIPKPVRIDVNHGHGFKTRVRYYRQRFFFAPKEKFGAELAKILCFFASRAKSGQVQYLEMNNFSTKVQSLVKVSYLYSKFDAATAEKMIKQDHVMGSILPTPFDWFSFIDPFLIFSPTILAVPVKRFNSGLYFIRSKPLRPTLEASSTMESFLAADANRPYVSNLDHPIMDPTDFSTLKVSFMMEKAVEGINQLNKYALDIRNHETTNFEVDSLSYLQFNSLLSCLMSDFRSIALTADPWTRVRLFFEATDKISNLRHYVSGESEKKLWNLFFYKSHKEFVLKAVRRVFKDSPGNLKQIMSDLLENSFKELYSSIGIGLKEEEIVDILASYRNLTHGTFLKRAQFEKLFLERHGQIPSSSLATILYFSMWALISDPEGFVEWTG